MARYKLKDGERIPFTAEEEKIRDAEEKTWKDGQADRDLAELRRERNILLQETDFLALSDVTMSDAWKKYRQDLRDITNGLTTVEEIELVVFPTKPSGA